MAKKKAKKKIAKKKMKMKTMNKSPYIMSDKIESTIDDLYVKLNDDLIAEMIAGQADITVNDYDIDPCSDDIRLGVKLGMKLVTKRLEEDNPNLRIYSATDDATLDIHFFVADEEEICERLKNKLLHLAAGVTKSDDNEEWDIL